MRATHNTDPEKDMNRHSVGENMDRSVPVDAYELGLECACFLGPVNSFLLNLELCSRVNNGDKFLLFPFIDVFACLRNN